jgi:protein SCO1/2
MIDGRFELTDHHGAAVSNEAYRGRYVLVFFGFTHCRVICPQALARISSALEALGPMADDLTALYISVDPERDSPAVMKAFLERRYPRFIGLTGSREQVDAAKQAFRVFAQARADDEDPDGYAVPHTAFTYVLGPDGCYLTHFPDHVDADTMAGCLRELLTA